MIIAISNHKGGTGKTTTAINMASALIKQGFKVLLVDFDPQANLTYALGVDEIRFDCADWILKKATAEKIIVENSNYSILPSSIDLYTKEIDIKKSFDRYGYKLLRELLDELSPLYEYIILDCPPSFSVYTKNALMASDYLIIPTTFDVLSIQGIRQVLAYVEELKTSSDTKLEILGVVGVNVMERRLLTNEVLQYIRDHFNLNIFNNYIRSNVKAAEAPSYSQSVIEYAPESISAKDYLAFTSEFLKSTQ